MPFSRCTKKSGFTLVEIVIYLFFLAVFTGAVVKSMAVIASSYGNLRGEKSVVSSAEVLLNRFSYEVRSASSLSGTFGSASGTLSLVRGATTTTISLDGSRAKITIGGVSDYLTSSDVVVTKLAFYKLAASSTSSGATIQLSLKSANDTAGLSARTFEATALIRNPQ